MGTSKSSLHASPPARLGPALAALLLAPGAAAQGPCWSEYGRILPQPGSSGSYADGIALSGDTALVGDTRDAELFPSGGACHVFQRTGSDWSHVAKLVPDDLAADDRFGRALALEGDTALVSSADLVPPADARWAVYAFERAAGAWSQTQKLAASDQGAGDGFGASVALQGDRLLVGAPSHDGAYSDTGAVYVFERSGGMWTEVQKLEAPYGLPYDRFGSSLALDGDTALVSAVGNDQQAQDAGAAYVFTRDGGGTWTLQQTLLALDSNPFAAFGGFMRLEGDRALIRGSGVYVFERSGSFWSYVELAPLGPVDGFFGYGLALRGDVAFVGNPGDDTLGSSIGAIHVFTRAGGAWSETDKIFPVAPFSPVDQFGYQLALDDATLLATAPHSSTTGAGAVHALSVVFDPVAASVASRNGGTNANTYSATPANIGETLVLTTTPITTLHNRGLVIAFDSPTQLTLAGGQTLLVLDTGGNGVLLDTGFFSGTTVVFEVQVPLESSLVGYRLYSQAIHAFGSTPFALTNAQDIVIGGCPE